MKIAEINPDFKSSTTPLKTITGLQVLYQISLNFLQAPFFRNWIVSYMQSRFSKYLTGFRKNNSTQNSLLRMIESWKVRLNNGSKGGVIIMDFSKAFDSLNHELLLTKLKDTINIYYSLLKNANFSVKKNQWLNNITYHYIAKLLFWMAWFVFLYHFAIIHC